MPASTRVPLTRTHPAPPPPHTHAPVQRLPDASFPFIVFHSENDTMVDVGGSKALYTQSQSADKSLRLVNHM